MSAILNLTTGIVFLKSWSGSISGGSMSLTGPLLLPDGECEPKLGEWLFIGGDDGKKFTLYPAKPELIARHPLPKEVTPVATNQTPTPSAEEALALIDEIEELAASICSNGADYAESVLGTAHSIGASVEKANSATPGQITALSNMVSGLQAWFHD